MPKVWRINIGINRDTEKLTYSKVFEQDIPKDAYDMLSKKEWKSIVRLDHIDIDNMFDGNNLISFFHKDKIVVEACGVGIATGAFELDGGRKWDDMIYNAKDRAIKNGHVNNMGEVKG